MRWWRLMVMTRTCGRSHVALLVEVLKPPVWLGTVNPEYIFEERKYWR